MVMGRNIDFYKERDPSRVSVVTIRGVTSYYKQWHQAAIVPFAVVMIIFSFI